MCGKLKNDPYFIIATERILLPTHILYRIANCPLSTCPIAIATKRKKRKHKQKHFGQT